MTRIARVTGATRLARVPEISKLARQRLKWFDHYWARGQKAALTCRYFGISRQTLRCARGQAVLPVEPALMTPIWCRVSTHGQRDLSLDSQGVAIRRVLEVQGYETPPQYILKTDWASLDLMACPQFQQLRRWIASAKPWGMPSARWSVLIPSEPCTPCL